MGKCILVDSTTSVNKKTTMPAQKKNKLVYYINYLLYIYGGINSYKLV